MLRFTGEYGVLIVLGTLIFALSDTEAGEVPPGCAGTQCRRARCGDICTEIDCSHFGNVCAGGAQAPVGVGWKYQSEFAAPEYPPDFTSENATIFYYFNLLSKGQFVPQLTLGDGLCNGTGAPNFNCAPCSPNPKTRKQWYMQAQYFWEGHDPGRDLNMPRVGRRGRQVSDGVKLRDTGMCHVIAGPLIPVEPGQHIKTVFFMDENYTWHASISNGEDISSIKVEHEYMEKNQTWGKTIGLGTCMEVDNLMSRGYYPPFCPPITVTVKAPPGTADGWQQPWKITEDPTCVFGPSKSTVSSKTSKETSTTVVQYSWPDA